MHIVISTKQEYRQAVERANHLRDRGAVAGENEELAALEGAIARYVAEPGEPAREPGHPRPRSRSENKEDG